MTTADFLDKIFQAMDEVLFPALTAYALYLLKHWIERHKPPQ